MFDASFGFPNLKYIPMQSFKALAHLEIILLKKSDFSMSHFCREFASYAVSESAIFSEPFGLSGSNFQNKLVLMIPTSGKNFKKIWEVGLQGLDDLIPLGNSSPR